MHWCPGNLFNAHQAQRKNAHTPAQARPCNGVAFPSPCNPLQPILQLELSPKNCQNPRQTMAQLQLRCRTGIISVIIRLGAGPGPHPVCLWFALALGRLRKHPLNSISTIFSGFSIMHLQSSSSRPLQIYTLLSGGFSSIHVS